MSLTGGLAIQLSPWWLCHTKTFRGGRQQTAEKQITKMTAITQLEHGWGGKETKARQPQGFFQRGCHVCTTSFASFNVTRTVYTKQAPKAVQGAYVTILVSIISHSAFKVSKTIVHLASSAPLPVSASRLPERAGVKQRRVAPIHSTDSQSALSWAPISITVQQVPFLTAPTVYYV